MNQEPPSDGQLRPRGRRPRQVPHATATRLLDVTVELLDSIPVDGVTIAMIRDRSGVSYGSIYHHYADVSDLVEQAILLRYSALKVSIAAVRTLLDATDAADVRTRAEQLFVLTLGPDRRKTRMDRAQALAAAQNRPRLAALIAQAQQEITDGMADVFVELQQRRWIRTDADPYAMSAFIQALFIGRVVDDVAERHADNDAWAALALLALRAVMFD